MKSKNLVIDSVARLKKIRLYLGMTRQQFGDALAISQYTIRSWENGAKTFTEDGVHRVVAALKKKINFSCSSDWLMHGVGLSPIFLYEERNIQNDFFAPIQSSNEKILNEIISFKQSNKSANVILVSDNMFNPVAHIGDYIGLASVDITRIEKHLEKLVLAILPGDLTKFGILRKEGRYFNVVNLLDGSLTKLSANNIDKISQLVWLRKVY